jgi:glycosyltransferase involved in cell wall biosynthesis
MHIAILSPSDRSYISKFLPKENFDELPIGYSGAIFIGTIIKELLAQNHTVTAITTSVALNNDYSTKSFKNGNFTWIVVPSRPHSIRMNGKKLGRIVDFFAQEIRELAKAIKSVNPDIVHAHWSYEFAGAAVKSGYPYLVTVHDNAFKILKFLKNSYRFGRLLMSEVILRKANHTSTVSPYMLSYVKKRCEKVKVIPNPVPVKIDEQQVEMLINERLTSLISPKIVMVNNGWNKIKNVKVALIAFSQLREKHPKSELHLYGNGYEIGGLAEQEANALGIKNINFYGTVSNEELFEQLKTCHLFLHPALEESFGVVLIEAMSLGVPTIGGTNSGAVPWVINNENLLVNVFDALQLKNKIEHLLNDENLYATLSMQCYKNVASRFSSLRITNDYLKYYNEIINTY